MAQVMCPPRTETLDHACGNYCSTLKGNCPGSYWPYIDDASCQLDCAGRFQWMVGTPCDTSVNTVDCRTTHASQATGTVQSVECVNAGPTGGGVCGSLCDNYCQDAQHACKGAQTLFPDYLTCKSMCAAFPTTGAPTDTSGNTIQCRIYYLGLAADATPGADTTNCPHANIVSDLCK
jgi:hypothetical protein